MKASRLPTGTRCHGIPSSVTSAAARLSAQGYVLRTRFLLLNGMAFQYKMRNFALPDGTADAFTAITNSCLNMFDLLAAELILWLDTE
jgi:hypothetical protein